MQKRWCQKNTALSTDSSFGTTAAGTRSSCSEGHKRAAFFVPRLPLVTRRSSLLKCACLLFFIVAGRSCLPACFEVSAAWTFVQFLVSGAWIQSQSPCITQLMQNKGERWHHPSLQNHRSGGTWPTTSRSSFIVSFHLGRLLLILNNKTPLFQCCYPLLAAVSSFNWRCFFWTSFKRTFSMASQGPELLSS